MSSQSEVSVAAQEETSVVDALDYNSFCKLLLKFKAEDEISGSNQNRAKLEAHRTVFSERFLPDVKFWMEWIQERISTTSADDEEMEKLDDLFMVALSQCASAEIAKEWIDNVVHRFEAELMDEGSVQTILEKVTSVYGVDIMDGAALWGQLTSFQLSIVEDLVDITANSDNIRKAKEALVCTYRRQYALPLLGNERSLSNFEKVLSEICIESDGIWIQPELLLNRFQRSEDQLKARILYEQNILSEEFLSSSLDDQVTAWKTYIRYEIDEKQLPRAHRLYERSIITTHQSVELWLDFADFAESTLKDWEIVESVTSRAVKVHRSNIELWLLYLLAIESNKCPFPSRLLLSFGRPLDIVGKESDVERKLDRAIKTALTCSFHSADDYLAILFYSCDFRRRKLRGRINSVPESHQSQDAINILKTELRKDVHALRYSFSEMEGFLDTCYPEWCGGWLQVYKYETALEDEIISDVSELFEGGSLHTDKPTDTDTDEDVVDNIEGDSSLSSQAGLVWERAVQRFSKFCYMWGDYIQWGRSAGDYDLCRALYRRALKTVKDHPEEMCKAYRSFEQQVGTLDDYCLSKARTKSIMKSASLRALRVAAAAREDAKTKGLKKALKAATSASAAAADVAAASSVNIIKTNEALSAVESSSSSSSSSSNNDRSSESRPHLIGLKRAFGSEVPTELRDDSILGTVTHREPGGSKRQKVDGSMSALHAVELHGLSTAIAGTAVCVKNLSFSSTIEEVSAHFASCGTIIAANLLLSKAGKSRGQAVLHFIDSSCAMRAMQLAGSMLGGRAVEVEESFAALPVEGETAATSSSKTPSTHHPTTVFVSKFSAEVTSEELKRMFSACGDILECRVMVDKRTNLSKCHGLVQFQDEFGKAAALGLNKKDCNGHVLSVLPSKFPALAEGISGSSHYGPASSSRASSKTDDRDLQEKPNNWSAVSSKNTLSFRPRKLTMSMKT